MATAPAEDDKGTAGLPTKHDHQQAAHLDKVTDYVEEQEIKADMGKVGRADWRGRTRLRLRTFTTVTPFSPT